MRKALLHECQSRPFPLVCGVMVRQPSALILLHGFGSSFDHNWRQTGWVDILADFGVTVPPIDLPGHGSSSPVTDEASYADVVEEVRRALPADGLIAGI